MARRMAGVGRVAVSLTRSTRGGATRQVYRPEVELAAFQERMATLYGERDQARGTAASVAWLVEEVGELSQAIRKGDREAQVHELGDVLAWLASLAGQLDLSLEEAAARYATGCPRCGATPCACP
jgi:NTP pyrophosphatase (non-canonical NTP hydrolase)